MYGRHGGGGMWWRRRQVKIVDTKRVLFVEWKQQTLKIERESIFQ